MPHAELSAGDSTRRAPKPPNFAQAQVYLHQLSSTLHKLHKLHIFVPVFILKCFSISLQDDFIIKDFPCGSFMNT